jgi:tRNA modification GTPase
MEARGIQACSWRDLERSTTDDPGKVDALEALVEAPTVRTAAILLDQYHGTFTWAVNEILTALAAGQNAEAEQKLKNLARYAPLGRHLTVPWKVVVAGAPNVGKSTLVNALAGYQRSLVAATPGTTRDVVTTMIAVDGWPVELADTAGMRESEEILERMGMERAQAAAGEADLCLWVLDSTAPPVWPTLQPGSLRFVVNKVDLPSAPAFTSPPGALYVSAHTGVGIAEVCQALSSWLVPDVPPPGTAVPFTSLLCDRIERALHDCSEGRPAEAIYALSGAMPGRW